MPVQIIRDTGKLLEFGIRGMLARSDYEQMIAVSRRAIAREGNIRVLVTLEEFSGWERHEGWGDMSFLMADGDQIEKIAIVGEQQWQDDTYAFTARGLRPTAIEFFPPSGLAQARAWLAG